MAELNLEALLERAMTVEEPTYFSCAVIALITRIQQLERASQPGSGEALAKALATYDSMRDGIGGCTDGGCVIKRPTRMRTNGGCKCATDKYKAQRMMYAGQKLADAARASLDGPTEGQLA